MDPHSLTYSRLPPYLRRPALAGLVSLADAAEIWDLTLLQADYSTNLLPDRLFPAAAVIWLWNLEVESPVQ